MNLLDFMKNKTSITTNENKLTNPMYIKASNCISLMLKPNNFIKSDVNVPFGEIYPSIDALYSKNPH